MKVGLVGYGVMGQIVASKLSKDDEVVGILSPGYLNDLFEMKEIPDVIIDFSHPNNLNNICDYASRYNVAVVIATTGYTDEQIKQIEELSKKTAVLFSANFSLGVILMNKVLRTITPILKDTFDIEVIEKHHNRKIDAPSGTAKMFINTIKDTDTKIVYGRSGASKRTKGEIGVHSIRGGNIVGEHEVIYAGDDEILSIKHEAHSRGIFASGAVVGARWLKDKDKGLYNMEDVLF